ncbi:MAG: TadE/TadG family type IV pilus assembly protein [Sphingomicrobium sp.]
MSALHRLLADQSGVSAAEYALLLGIIAGSVALAAVELGDSIACSLERSTAIIDGTDVPNHPNYGKSDPNGNAYGHKNHC